MIILATTFYGATIIGEVMVEGGVPKMTDDGFFALRDVLRFEEQLSPQGARLGLRPLFFSCAGQLETHIRASEYFEVTDERLLTNYRDALQQAKAAASGIILSKQAPPSKPSLVR